MELTDFLDYVNRGETIRQSSEEIAYCCQSFLIF